MSHYLFILIKSYLPQIAMMIAPTNVPVIEIAIKGSPTTPALQTITVLSAPTPPAPPPMSEKDLQMERSSLNLVRADELVDILSNGECL
jgi:hypothetical protein